MTIIIESATKTIFYDSEEAMSRVMKIFELIDMKPWKLLQQPKHE